MKVLLHRMPSFMHTIRFHCIAFLCGKAGATRYSDCVMEMETEKLLL